MTSKNSVKLYNYEEINNISVTEKHFSIIDKNSKESIIFISKEVSQMKCNYEKGYFIIEGKMAEVQTYIKTAKLQKIKDLDREICIIWNHSGKVREYRFTGRCVCYTEHYSGNNNYFEIVIQETTSISVYNKFMKVGDFYVYAEIEPNSLKTITKFDAFWAENGIVLGTAAVVEGVIAVITGGSSILVHLTIIFGINTIASSTVDMSFCFSGEAEKLGSFNLVRDAVFGNIGKLLTDKAILKKNVAKNVSNVAYFSSEILLGSTGLIYLLKDFFLGWKLGKAYVSMTYLKTRICGVPGIGNARQKNYGRFGYNVYQFIDGMRLGNGYVIQMGAEIKEIKKTISTNSSAIELVR